MRENALTGFKDELLAIEPNVDEILLEREEVGNPCNLTPSLRIGPGDFCMFPEIVIASEPLLWAECLEWVEHQHGRVDVVSGNIPAGGEA